MPRDAAASTPRSRFTERILAVIAKLAERRGSSTKEILSYLLRNVDKPTSRNLTLQVQQALKQAVIGGLLRLRAGRYKIRCSNEPSPQPAAPTKTKPTPRTPPSTPTSTSPTPSSPLTTKSKTKPETKPEAKPGMKPGMKPGTKPGTKPGAKPGAKPGVKLGAKTSAPKRAADDKDGKPIKPRKARRRTRASRTSRRDKRDKNPTASGAEKDSGAGGGDSRSSAHPKSRRGRADKKNPSAK